MKKIFLILLFSIAFSLFSQETIESKFSIPDGFEREIVSDYHKWLITHPLKKENVVINYKGESYNRHGELYAAVFDYRMGATKSHQCADAAIYLYARHKWDSIHKLNENIRNYEKLKFHSSHSTLMTYEDYLRGVKYGINDDYTDIKIDWTNLQPRADNIQIFEKWLYYIFSWSSTYSIEGTGDSEPVELSDISPGDFFNQNRHVISIVDVIRNKETGDKKYILSQSIWRTGVNTYGEEQYILINPETGNIWYDLIPGKMLVTPEWDYYPWEEAIRRFK